MALHTETRRAGPFLSDGVTTVFPFDFKLFETEELAIFVSYDQGITEAEIPSDLYTVTLNANQDQQCGGFVSLKQTVSAGAHLSIVSTVEYLQETVFTNRGGFYPEILNECLDRLTILTQQLKEKIDRAVTVTATSEMTGDELRETLLAVAATANDYAIKAEQTYNATLATKAQVDQVRIHVDQQKALVDASEAEVEEDRLEVEQMLGEAKKVNEVTVKFEPHLNELIEVGNSIEDVRAVASDLQGLPIESMDLGLIRDAATPIYDTSGSTLAYLAANIDKIQIAIDNLEEIQAAAEAAFRAETAAQSAEVSAANASAFANEAEVTVERVKEIEKTNYAQIYEQGVS